MAVRYPHCEDRHGVPCRAVRQDFKRIWSRSARACPRRVGRAWRPFWHGRRYPLKSRSTFATNVVDPDAPGRARLTGAKTRNEPARQGKLATQPVGAPKERRRYGFSAPFFPALLDRSEERRVG